jgi:hypothetical protein
MANIFRAVEILGRGKSRNQAERLDANKVYMKMIMKMIFGNIYCPSFLPNVQNHIFSAQPPATIIHLSSTYH